MKTIGVKEAKAKFSQTLESADENPIIITHHSKPRSVLMSYEHYQNITKEKRTGWDIFKKHNWDDFELEREHVDVRDIEF